LAQPGIPATGPISVGDFGRIVIHYAKTLGTRRVHLAQTARNAGDDFKASTDHLGPHFGVPVTVLR